MGGGEGGKLVDTSDILMDHQMFCSQALSSTQDTESQWFRGRGLELSFYFLFQKCPNIFTKYIKYTTVIHTVLWWWCVAGITPWETVSEL